MDKEKSYERLVELIKEKDVTFYKVAKDLGFSNTVFSDWKAGKSMPKTDKLLKIAEYFNVPICYFIVGKE